MITEIEARYRVLTPLFCAGADTQKAELREPSFKGVLRFWWRALAWQRLNGDLPAIQKEEAALFGSASGGQSRVSIRIDQPPRLEQDLGKGLSVSQGARYLGYGVLEQDASNVRACLLPPIDFDVHLHARGLCADQSNSLIRALAALGTLGGMGARSRRGYGSLTLTTLTMNRKQQWKSPSDACSLRDKIKQLYSYQRRNDLPQYTALSTRSRHVVLSSGDRRPLNLLDRIGNEYKAAIRSTDRSKRAAFGLPRGRRADRRASPLFIHIHACRDTPVAVLSFLPARFLPDGRSDLSAGGSRVLQAAEAELYKPVQRFLDRVLDEKERREPLTNVTEIVP